MEKPKCPHLRSDLPPLIPRIAKLPVDDRGYPIPFFVDYDKHGKADFRTMDGRKFNRCIQDKLCWICGDKLGHYLTFVIGPMCTISHTTAEPPSHLDCALWSVKGCPFLNTPHQKRRELADSVNPAGVMITRNPGVICVWTCISYSIFSDGRGGRLIQVGDPTKVSWWREGRTATRKEVQESIDSGLPHLGRLATEEEDIAALKEAVEAVQSILPEPS